MPFPLAFRCRFDHLIGQLDTLHWVQGKFSSMISSSSYGGTPWTWTVEFAVWLQGVLAVVAPYVARLAIWRGYEAELRTLLLYAVGIAVYTALVFSLYQNLSRRDPFRFPGKPGWPGRFTRLAEVAVLAPIVNFAFFAVLSLSLFVMAKSQSTFQILLLSMGVVVGVRVAAFVSETMSADLAKLVPLSLLAVVLVDPGYLSLSQTWLRFSEAAALGPLFLRFMALFIVIEGTLHTLWSVAHRITEKRPGKTVRVPLQTGGRSVEINPKPPTK